MGATSDNYIITANGIDYSIASDYVKPTSGSTAHFQVVKVAYGLDNTVIPVSTDYPLPASLYGSWTNYDYSNAGYNTIATTVIGFNSDLVVTSGLTALAVTFGTINVQFGSTLETRSLAGGNTTGEQTGDYLAVQGLATGYPIGITVASAIPVTGEFTISSNIGAFGVSGATAMGVTFGVVSMRGITAATDTITVYGGGTAATVSAGLFGFTGTEVAPLYSESNALNVNVKTFNGTLTGISNGITVSANNLDIRDLSYTTDTVSVVGQGASDNSSLSTVPTYLATEAPNGTLVRAGGVTGAGWSGSALNVYLVNTGITFTASVTLGTAVGISQDYANPIQITGSTSAVNGVWVAGDTANGPVIIKGFSGGLLPVEMYSNTLVTESNFNTQVAAVQTNTNFLIATKKALYDPSVSVGAFDMNDSLSIYTLIKNAVNTHIHAIADTVNTSTNTIGVAVESYTLQPSFMARTVSVGYSAKNLTEYSAAAGFTCANGVRIKISRIAAGANASQNELLCVISEADAALYGATAGTAAYTMYHGDELFLEVDNIDKIKVFYPPYSAGFAPHNTGNGITFSFYAS